MRRLTWGLTVVVLTAVLPGCGSSGASDTGLGPDEAADVGDTTQLTDSMDVPLSDSDDLAETSDPGPGFDAWTAFDDPPATDFAWFGGRTGLRALLPFAYHWRPGTPQADAGHLGDFAIGNGRTFSLLGLAFPLNTLHGMMGPTYARRQGSFGDLALQLGDATGAPRSFQEEWIGAFRTLPAVLTVGRLGDLRLATIDLAPLPPDGQPARAVHAAIWRVVVVRNDGSAASPPASLVLTANQPQTPVADAIVETTKDGVQVAWFTSANAVATAGGLVLTLPSIPAGGEWTTDLMLAHGTPETAPAAVRAAVDGEVFDTLVADTTAVYQAFETATTQVTTPDPLVNDSIVNLRRTLWVQVSAQGASTPLSRYAMAWTRDLSGVVRPLLALGAVPLAERIMDYYYGVAAQAGWLTDAYEADVTVDLANLPTVDWESLAPLAKKAQAEGPAYLPIMYSWLRATTGAKDRVQGRIGFLRHAIHGQALSADFLLPFSGDETYRASMNMAVGLDLEYEHHLKSWSLSSGMLMATGARALADLEDALGNTDKSLEARTLATNVEVATHQEFGMDDGCLSAFVTRTDGKVWPPHEDALLTGTWGGPPWDSGPDLDLPLKCLLDRFAFGPGAIQSPLDPQYIDIFGIPIEKGVYTGMLPGYTLRALTDAGHPQAEDAFGNLRRSMSPSGNYPEYSIADDFSALEALYDGTGAIGDFTARYRPWEGGINLEALYHYLTGYRPDAPLARLYLRPHLPAGWPSLAASPLRIGDTRVSLDVRRETDGMSVEVRHLSGPKVTVTLVHDAYDGATPTVTIGGTVVPPADLGIETHFQTTVVRMPDCDVGTEAGASCRWIIR